MSSSMKTWGQVLLLYATGLGAAGQFAKLSSGFAGLEVFYGEAAGQLGFAVSLISFLGVALGLVAGMIVARIGFRRVLVAGLALGAVLSALQATLPAMPLLMASRLVEGAAHLAIVVAAPTLIAEITGDRERPVAMSLWSTFFGTGFALFAFFVTPLAEVHGPALPLWLHAGVMAVLAAIVPVVLPPARTHSEESLGLREIAARHVAVYRSPFMAAPALGWLCYTLTFVSVLTLLPRLVEDSEWLATALPLVGIVMSLTLVAALLRRVPAVPVVIAGFALAALGVAGIALAPASPLPWIALFAVLSLVQAGSFAAIPQLNSDLSARALSNGAVAQMGNLGNLAGTPVLLGVLALGGLPGALTFLGACYAGGVTLHLWLAQRRRLS